MPGQGAACAKALRLPGAEAARERGEGLAPLPGVWRPDLEVSSILGVLSSSSEGNARLMSAASQWRETWRKSGREVR